MLQSVFEARVKTPTFSEVSIISNHLLNHAHVFNIPAWEKSTSLRVGTYKPFLEIRYLDKIQGYQMQNHKPQNITGKIMKKY